MGRVKSISDVIEPNRGVGRQIKDYTFLQQIYKDYWDFHYFAMCRNIKRYGSFRFSADLLIYLRENHRNELFKQFVFKDITDIYISQL